MCYDAANLVSMMLLNAARLFGILEENGVDLRKQALGCMVIKPTDNSSALYEPW